MYVYNGRDVVLQHICMYIFSEFFFSTNSPTHELRGHTHELRIVSMSKLHPPVSEVLPTYVNYGGIPKSSRKQYCHREVLRKFFKL